VAPSNVPVLIQGESGTGKELVASDVHHHSQRQAKPLVCINCAAIPDGLIESELFGHERGAFTGALHQRIGAFERAAEGSLLLDEISEMRLDLQAKLLRVLQEQSVVRVGGHEPIRATARIIATTNRDLLGEVRAGRFRHDLYYRLNVISIVVPPLRERREDIPPLVNHFLARIADAMEQAPRRVDPCTMDLLAALPWPGNARQLEHTLHRAVLMTDEPILQQQHFPRVPEENAHVTVSPDLDPVGETAGSTGIAPIVGGLRLTSFNLREAEDALITAVLVSTNGNRTLAAERLGVSVRTLHRRLGAKPTGPSRQDARRNHSAQMTA
jgi:DNA-binding NtrC family response regulator